MKKNDLTKFKKVFKEIKVIADHSVKVGVSQDAGIYDNGLTIAEVGEFHEFGTKRGIPRRSFLRGPLLTRQATINKFVKNGWKNILEGKSSAMTQLNKLGVLGESISKESFKTQGYGDWKALDPRTIEAKGSSKILQDTGKLVQSIHYWVAKD